MISSLYFLSASDSNGRSGEMWQEAESVSHEVINHESIWMNICMMSTAPSITAIHCCCNVTTAATCPNKHDRKKRTFCSKLLSMVQKYNVSAEPQLNSPTMQHVPVTYSQTKSFSSRADTGGPEVTTPSGSLYMKVLIFVRQNSVCIQSCFRIWDPQTWGVWLCC